MSRTGKQPIVLPKEVKVKIEPKLVHVESAKGKLNLRIPAGIAVEAKDNTLVVKRADDTKQVKALHGTIRALIQNMVEGVTKGYKKELEIVGTGYKASLKGKSLVILLGFSHPVEMPIPEGLKVTVPTQTRVVVEGPDKQQVGEFAAVLRRHYPPEPYKGKGVRYAGETVRKKLGKALAK